MYKIVLDSGRILGYTEEILWIRKHENGCYIQCPQSEAEGIAYKSIPYSFSTDSPLEGAKGTVYLFRDEYDDASAENANDIASLENVVCDISKELAEVISDVNSIAKIWKNRIEARYKLYEDCPEDFKPQVIDFMKQDVANDIITAEEFEDLTGQPYE